MVTVNRSDMVSFAAAIILFCISAIIFLDVRHFNYQVNTGLVCAVFCLLPFVLRHLNLITLPSPLVLIIEASIFLHAYGVLFLQYDSIVVWDTVTHTVSSVTVAFCVLFTLMMVTTYDHRVSITPFWMGFFVFIVMMTMGVYWEVFELVVDELTGTTMQYSPWDTVRDLSCDALGGLLVSLYAYFYLRRHTGEEMVSSLELHPRLQMFIQCGSRRGRRASESRS